MNIKEKLLEATKTARQTETTRFLKEEVLIKSLPPSKESAIVEGVVTGYCILDWVFGSGGLGCVLTIAGLCAGVNQLANRRNAKEEDLLNKVAATIQEDLNSMMSQLKVETKGENNA